MVSPSDLHACDCSRCMRKEREFRCCGVGSLMNVTIAKFSDSAAQMSSNCSFCLIVLSIMEKIVSLSYCTADLSFLPFNFVNLILDILKLYFQHINLKLLCLLDELTPLF